MYECIYYGLRFDLVRLMLYKCDSLRSEKGKIRRLDAKKLSTHFERSIPNTIKKMLSLRVTTNNKTNNNILEIVK